MTPFKLKNLMLGIVLAVTSGASIAAQPGDPVIRKYFADSKPGTAPTLPVAKGAPNIIWILLDDVGYGAASTFGGGARTPVLDDLAKNGLTYTNFNTTAVCSPSRAALMTGRNHHMVGMGLLPQKLMAAEFPGYTGRLLPKDGTIADYLRVRGYQSYPVPQKAENFAGKEVWELYNVNEDPTELNNLAKSNPAKLAQMKAVFDKEAKANQVYPLMNWSDIFVGIQDFQRKAGLLPGAAAPQK